jgi:hypothetical protein
MGSRNRSRFVCLKDIAFRVKVPHSASSERNLPQPLVTKESRKRHQANRSPAEAEPLRIAWFRVIVGTSNLSGAARNRRCHEYPHLLRCCREASPCTQTSRRE